MVKHIILWTLNPELSDDQKKTVKAGIKEGLEGLVGKVPGLIDVKVQIDGRLASSNADVMLDSNLESEEALTTPKPAARRERARYAPTPSSVPAWTLKYQVYSRYSLSPDRTRWRPNAASMRGF